MLKQFTGVFCAGGLLLALCGCGGEHYQPPPPENGMPTAADSPPPREPHLTDDHTTTRPAEPSLVNGPDSEAAVPGQ
jgi:hypothetical protein